MPAETLSEKLAPAITTARKALIQGNMDMALYAGEGNIELMDDFFDATGTDKSGFHAERTGWSVNGRTSVHDPDAVVYTVSLLQ